MKKKVILIVLAIVIFLAVLFVPVPKGPYRDGGTREYAALTYKVVDWNRLTRNGIYEKTRVYFFPENFKSIGDLWHEEEDEMETVFYATVVEEYPTSVVVIPTAGCAIFNFDQRISLDISYLEDIGAQVGSIVRVTFKGPVTDSDQVMARAAKWELSSAVHQEEYTDQWIDKETAEKRGGSTVGHYEIAEIYSNCVFVRPLFNGILNTEIIKLNGALLDDWCVGDLVECTYEHIYFDKENKRWEGDVLSVKASNLTFDSMLCGKPVIYLYPEEETEVSVKVNFDGVLTSTYPAYNGGWNVTAAPDGTLTDAKGQTYNYLYWEGETHTQWDMTKGFCVKGADTAAFLEQALEKLGLNRKEANEFIVYWLPLMEQNPYNVIAFQTDVYTQAAQLQIDPAPDTLIRVFMAWQASENYVNLEAQELTAPDRTGFTVVEWGGSEVK